MPKTLFFLACALLAMGLVPPGASSETLPDEFWVPNLDSSPHPNGAVRCMIFHEGSLVVGGDFTQGGNTPLNHIGLWDGNEWRGLGDGFNRSVLALASFNGDLYAAGNFTHSGVDRVNYIAKWDGSQWVQLGAGSVTPIHSLAIWNDGVVALGLPRGLPQDGALDLGGWDVYELDPLNPPVMWISHWNGTQWQPLHSSRQEDIKIEEVYTWEGDLYAAGGTLAGVPRARIFKFDGASEGELPGWSLVYPNDPTESTVNYRINTFGTWNGRLVACGYAESGNQPKLLIREGDANWVHRHVPNAGAVSSLAELEGDLILGGQFTGLSERKYGVIRMSETAWSWLGRLKPTETGVRAVYALASHSGKVYAGGLYGGLELPGYFVAPEALGANLSVLREFGWEHVVEDGAQGPPQPEFGLASPVARIFNMDGRLHAFSRSYVLQWDNGWHTLQGAFNGLDAGQTFFSGASVSDRPTFWQAGAAVFRVAQTQHSPVTTWAGAWENTVLDFPQDATNILYVPNGGLFHMADNAEVGRRTAYSWIGTGNWAAYPPLESVSASSCGLKQLRSGLGWYKDRLVAYETVSIGGEECSVNRELLGTIAIWDASSKAWEPIASLGDVHISGFFQYRGELYVAGAFDAINGVNAANLAKWDGTAWHPVGQGTSGPVFCLQEYRGRIVVGGWFTAPGPNIASWDGEQWRAHGSGTDGAVTQLLTHDDQLIAVGEFHRAGRQAAQYAARWYEPNTELALQSVSASRDGDDVRVRFLIREAPPEVASVQVYREDENGIRVPVPGVKQEKGVLHEIVDSENYGTPGKHWIAGLAPDNTVYSWYGPLITEGTALRYALQPPHPNPFAQTATIAFSLEQHDQVRIAVFDVNGRHIVDLINGPIGPGNHSLDWHGTDAEARTVSNGIYFVRMITSSGAKVQKLLRLGGGAK